MKPTNVKPARRLQQSLAALERLLGGSVDCLLEAQNNVERAEWNFATTNLRKLFRNAAAIQRQRPIVLREVRLAREEVDR